MAQNEALRAENTKLSELHADAARRLSDYQLGLTSTLPPALQDDSWLVGQRNVALTGVSNTSKSPSTINADMDVDELRLQNAELRRKLHYTRARNEELARRMASVAQAYETRRNR